MPHYTLPTRGKHWAGPELDWSRIIAIYLEWIWTLKGYDHYRIWTKFMEMNCSVFVAKKLRLN